MLKFTPGQALAVNQSRSAFNGQATVLETQVAMAMVGNAVGVPLDAWRRIDGEAVGIQRDVLQVFNRLSAAKQTPIGVGDIVNFYPKISDSGEVQVNLDGRSEGKADQAVVRYEGTPVPIFTSEARFGWRQMEVIRKQPSSIDTDTIGNHQRKVAEKMEDMALNGLPGIVVAGATIYGLRTFPQRATDVHGVDLNGATGAQWLAAISKVIFKAIGQNAFGKVTIFLNYGDFTYADLNEFVAGYPKTILQRLKEISNVAEFVPCSRVPVNELLGIADIASGKWGTILSAMPMVTRPKARLNPEDDYSFGVLAMCAPQFKSDYDGRTSLVQVTKT